MGDKASGWLDFCVWNYWRAQVGDVNLGLVPKEVDLD